MLNAAETYGGAKVYACDLSTVQNAPKFEGNTETGFVIKKYVPKYLDSWQLHAPGLINEHLDKIGKDIDFAFLDAAHLNPGEILDTILLLPYLKKDAVIVYHDTALHSVVTKNHYIYASTTSCAVATLKGSIITPPPYYNNSIISNITAVKLDYSYSYQQQASSLFLMLFNSEWKYFPSDEQMKSILISIEQHYGEEGLSLFKAIVDHQKKWVNSLYEYRKKEYGVDSLIQEKNSLIQEKDALIQERDSLSNKKQDNIKKISTYSIFNIPIYKKVKKIKNI